MERESSSPKNLVILSCTLDDTIIRTINQRLGAENVLCVDSFEKIPSAAREKLGGRKADRIDLVGHGAPGRFSLGTGPVMDSSRDSFAVLDGVQTLFAKEGKLRILGCYVGKHGARQKPSGISFQLSVSHFLGVPVLAPVDALAPSDMGTAGYMAPICKLREVDATADSLSLASPNLTCMDNSELPIAGAALGSDFDPEALVPQNDVYVDQEGTIARSSFVQRFLWSEPVAVAPLFLLETRVSKSENEDPFAYLVSGGLFFPELQILVPSK